MKIKYQSLIYLLTIIIFSCHNETKKNVERDTTVTVKTSFNNLFLDSEALENFLSRDTVFEKYAQQFSDFYKQRNYEFAWFDSGALAEQAGNFMNLLNHTMEDLQDSSLYNDRLQQLYNTYSAGGKKINKDSALETELLLTGQFFNYAAKVYKGSDIDVTQLGWFIPRKKIDLAAILDSSIHSKGTAPEDSSTLSIQYNTLQSFLPRYNAIAKNETWDSLPTPDKKWESGDKDPLILKIKHRLFLTDDMDEDDSTNVYDRKIIAGIKSFQRRMGLSVDGVIGQKMMDELNVPATDRVKQILVNLERLRWMPAENDSVYFLVNIPEYKLHVFDSGKAKFSMNVIVGASATSTVIFNGKLKYIVFSPYWNIPPSIVQKEIIPGIAKDKNYIADHNMEITGKSNGLPVVRQKPGPDNSLGLVKFLFPNSYDIYLHDTPNHDLFTQSSRGLSHGCIRLSNPSKIAQFLLRNDTTWTANKIDSCMHLTKEYWVTLPANQQVPVFIVYFTAWVDKNGKLNFRKDIYGHDAELANKLFVK
jgi:L,D-transpeptidase YcbB